MKTLSLGDFRQEDLNHLDYLGSLLEGALCDRKEDMDIYERILWCVARSEDLITAQTKLDLLTKLIEVKIELLQLAEDIEAGESFLSLIGEIDGKWLEKSLESLKREGGALG